MGALDDLAAAIVGSQAQEQIAAENPYLKFKGVPDLITQALQQSAIKSPGQFSNKNLALYGLGSGLLSGLLGGAGENYQSVLTDRYQKAATDAINGVENTQDLPTSLFRSAKDAGGIFKLRKAYETQAAQEQSDRELNKAIKLKQAESDLDTQKELLKAGLDNPRKLKRTLDLLRNGSGSGSGSSFGSDSSTPRSEVPASSRVNPVDVYNQVLDQTGEESIAQAAYKSALDEQSGNKKEIDKFLADQRQELYGTTKNLGDLSNALTKSGQTGSTLPGEDLGRSALLHVQSIYDPKAADRLGARADLESQAVVLAGQIRKMFTGATTERELQKYLEAVPGVGKLPAENKALFDRLNNGAMLGKQRLDFIENAKNQGYSLSEAHQMYDNLEGAIPSFVNGEINPERLAIPLKDLNLDNLHNGTVQMPADTSAVAAPELPAGQGQSFLDSIRPDANSAQSVAKANLVAGANFGDTALFGIPRRAVAGAMTLYGEGKDLLGIGDNKTLGERNAENMAQVSGAIDAANAEHPVVAGIAQLGGMLDNPVTRLFAPARTAQLEKLPGVVGTVASTANKLYNATGKTGVAARAATMAGVTGAQLVGQGKDVSSSDLTGAALTSAIVDVAAKGASKLAPAAKSVFDRMIGISKANYNQVAKSLKAADLAEVKQRFANALSIIEKEHGINPAQLMKSDEAVMLDLTQKAQSSIDSRLDQVDAIAGIADKASKKPVVLSGGAKAWESVDKAISSGGASEKASNAIRKEAAPIQLQIQEGLKRNKKNQISYLLSELRSLNKTYKPGVLGFDDAKTAIANDIRSAIQARVDDLASLGLISSKYAGKIKQAGQEARNLIHLQTAWKSKIPGAMADDALSGVARSLYTTGSAGAPGAGQLGEALGGPSGKAAMFIAALAASSKRLGRPISYLLSKPQLANTLNSPEFRFLANQTTEQSNDETSAIPQPDFSVGGGIFAAKKKVNNAADSNLIAPNGSLGDFNASAPATSPFFKPSSYVKPTASPYDGDLTGSGTMTDLNIHPVVDKIFSALISQESNGNPNAVSNKGAIGLAQVMPETAKAIAKELGIEKYDLKDPDTSELFGKFYLSKMMNQFDDVRLALAAYNAGPGAVSSWIKRFGTRDWSVISKRLNDKGVYSETTNYVPKIMERVNKAKLTKV